MSTTTRYGDENLIGAMLAGLNQQMLKEAEPIIQAAIKEAEAAMRRRLAEGLIALVDTSVSFERMGADLRVTIRRPGAG